jgi:hypothetical protein
VRWLQAGWPAAKNVVAEIALFRTRTPDGAEHYYSAVRVNENGKTRVEFIAADPQSPKVQQAIRDGRVKDGRQPDIDYALAQSRWSRLAPDDQAKLAAQANQIRGEDAARRRRGRSAVQREQASRRASRSTRSSFRSTRRRA